jgi:hypothetical protein
MRGAPVVVGEVETVVGDAGEVIAIHPCAAEVGANSAVVTRGRVVDDAMIGVEVLDPADAVGLISFSLFLPDRGLLAALSQRLSGAGAPARADDDGRIRTVDPDGIFVELVGD